MSAGKSDTTAAQQEFLRAIVHDLRAPLRHVTSYGALVRELLQELESPSAQVLEALPLVQTMEHSARRMGRMIDGLEAIARAASAPLQPQPLALAAVWDDARAALAAETVGRRIQWQQHVAPDGLALQADSTLIRQLLHELLANALKFTRLQPEARIALTAAAGAPGRLRVQIADNGAGFDPARAGALGQVFQRLHREAQFDGVGTGLALCQAIARRHGAHLALTAQSGAGCCVTLDWPAAG